MKMRVWDNFFHPFYMFYFVAFIVLVAATYSHNHAHSYSHTCTYWVAYKTPRISWHKFSGVLSDSKHHNTWATYARRLQSKKNRCWNWKINRISMKFNKLWDQNFLFGNVQFFFLLLSGLATHPTGSSNSSFCYCISN